MEVLQSGKKLAALSDSVRLKRGTLNPGRSADRPETRRRLANPVSDYRALLKLEIERSADKLLQDLEQLLGKR